MTLTRRQALAAPAVLLPLAPAPAWAGASAPDPVIAVAEALIAQVIELDRHPSDLSDADWDAGCERLSALERRLSGMVAVTPAGLAAQLRAGAYVITSVEAEKDFTTLKGFVFDTYNGEALYANLIASAEAMTQRSG